MGLDPPKKPIIYIIFAFEYLFLKVKEFGYILEIFENFSTGWGICLIGDFKTVNENDTNRGMVWKCFESV